MPTPAELADQYLAGANSLREAVKGMSREHLTARPVPGKWSTLEVVCHIADFEPVLADRWYGPNTHCALLVDAGGVPSLLDPGFLILEPVALPRERPLRLSTPFNDLVLEPREAGGRVELHTIQEGRTAHRLTYRAGPADAGEFLKAWEESFDWDMMKTPLLTRVREGSQLYLHGGRLLVRTREGSTRTEISPEEAPAWLAEAERAVAAAPGAWSPLQYQSKALMIMQRLDEAEAVSRRIPTINSNAYFAWMDLGYIAAVRGDRSAAAQAFRNCLAIMPGFRVCREALEKLERPPL